MAIGIGEARFTVGTHLSAHIQIEGEAVNNHEWIKKWRPGYIIREPDYILQVLSLITDALEWYLAVRGYKISILPDFTRQLKASYKIEVNCYNDISPSQLKKVIIEALEHHGLRCVESGYALVQPKSQAN
jgi:hypothetical protein